MTIHIYHDHHCWLLDTDLATKVFTELREIDPYRLENMDIFSNLLYVKVRQLYNYDESFYCHFGMRITKYSFLSTVSVFRCERLQEMRTELASLAHHCSAVDTYREETCCVIGKQDVSGECCS